jgi:hypothetical protein
MDTLDQLLADGRDGASAASMIELFFVDREALVGDCRFDPFAAVLASDSVEDIARPRVRSSLDSEKSDFYVAKILLNVLSASAPTEISRRESLDCVNLESEFNNRYLSDSPSRCMAL